MRRPGKSGRSSVIEGTSQALRLMRAFHKISDPRLGASLLKLSRRLLKVQRKVKEPENKAISRRRLGLGRHRTRPTDTAYPSVTCPIAVKPREEHLSTAGWISSFVLSGLILNGFHAAAA